MKERRRKVKILANHRRLDREACDMLAESNGIVWVRAHTLARFLSLCLYLVPQGQKMMAEIQVRSENFRHA